MTVDPGLPAFTGPAYADLPVEPRSGRPCSWGIFGEDDEIGTLNRITPQLVRGATLGLTGETFSLNWELTQPDPPIFDRHRLKRTVIDLSEGYHPGTDEYYEMFSPQGSSQWDALNHIGHPVAGFYNGTGQGEVMMKGRNGIHRVAQRGIAGRFVLADVDRHLESRGAPLDHMKRRDVTPEEIDETLEAQGSSPGFGDILLVRFGWITWYRAADQATREAIGHGGYFPHPGLAPGERSAQWLWDRGFAAVGADNPALEAMPVDVTSEDRFLHYTLIPLLGFTIGELLDLDRLAAACARTGRYTGLLAAAPLNTPGGSGSPANALAIL